MPHNQGMTFWNGSNNCRTTVTAVGVDDLGGMTDGFNVAPDFDSSLTFDLGCGSIYNMR